MPIRSFTTREIREKTYRTIQAQVPPEALSLLAQVRRTLEVGDLLPSVLEHGQQTPGVAVVLTPHEAHDYVVELNEIYGTKHTVKDLVPVKLDQKKRYFVLIAGHRRLETCIHINDLVKKGGYTFTSKYRGKYRVELRFGLSTRDAIALQFNENRHVQVPSHEEAHAAWGFWMWLRRHDEQMSVAKFARIIGRSSEWVRNALRFCELPASVQEYVEGNGSKPRLPYRILVEVARLADGYEQLLGQPLGEDAMHRWIRRAVLGRLDAIAFGRMVSEYLNEKRLEQQGQLTLFGNSDALRTDTRPLRRVVAPHMIRDIWKWFEYMKTVNRLHIAGQLGPLSFLGPEPDLHVREMYSPGSPLRLLANAGGLFSDLMPHLIELAIQEGGRHRPALALNTEEVHKAHALLHVLAEHESRLRFAH